MNEELSKKLLDNFPQLFRNRDTSSMQRGFECCDGWFDLIYQLSLDIESVAREYAIPPDSLEWPRCRQVKEKMGSLRFVVFANQQHKAMHDRISDLILTALNQSVIICECCSKPGELVTRHGVSSL